MRRRRFQIHLSTALVLMIVSGVLLGTNLANRNYREKSFALIKRSNDDSGVYTWIEYRGRGWPFCYWIENEPDTFSFDRNAMGKGEVHAGWRARIPMNLFVAFGILAPVGISCEFLVRRRSIQRSKLENRETA